MADRAIAPAPHHGRRQGSRYLRIALVVVLFGGVAGFGALVEFAGYCASGVLPIRAQVSAAPHVQNVGSEAATIMWRTDDPTDGQVAFGVGSQLNTITGSDLGTVHDVRPTGLQPDTEYTYRVRSGATVFDTGDLTDPPG